MLKFNCIMCPLGCELSVDKSNKQIIVTGNNCVRGKEYAQSEVTRPMRVVSSLVKYNGGVVPVKTSAPIPKELIMKCMQELGKIYLNKRPKFHSVIVKNILNTGVDIVVCG